MWTNLEFKMWIRDINASALSQDQLKEEAKKFSPIFENVNKKTIQRKVEDFIKIDKKELSEVSMILFKEKGGKEGKKKGRNDIPPETYCPRDFKDFKMRQVDPRNKSKMKCEMCDFNLENEEEVTTHIQTNHKETLKRVFSKEVSSLAFDHKQYRDWLAQDHCVDIGDITNAKENHVCKDVKENNSENMITLTRELPSGPNIFETQTTKLKVQKDGKIKKTVIIGQVANITTRKKRF